MMRERFEIFPVHSGRTAYGRRTSADLFAANTDEALRFTFVSNHLIFGWRSSCERAELMFALVMRLTPV
jgi:hypothetical protein